MPVNFEIDFIQPLLKDLRDGEYKDIQDYVDAITRYYATTISKGNPIGVPPTLPSPITLGVIVPIATTSNGFNTTFNRPNQDKFNRAVSAYYNAKELIIGQESIEIKLTILKGIIAKANYEKKLIEANLKAVRTASAEVARLPEYIQSLVVATKLLVSKYELEFRELKKVIVEGIDIAETSNTNREDKERVFQQLFPEEAGLLDTLTSFRFNNIQEAQSVLNNVKQFVENINKPTLEEESADKRYIKVKVTQAADKVIKLVSALSVPEKFVGIIDEVRGDFTNIESNIERSLNVARQASKSIGIIKTVLQPQIAVAEQWIKVKKANLEKRVKEKIEEQKGVIDKKIQDLKKRKDRSEKKKLFEKYKNDAKDLKKQNEELIKKTKGSIKLVSDIIVKSTKLTENTLGIEEILKKSLERYKQEIEALKSKTQDSDIRLQSNFSEIEQYLNKRNVKELEGPIQNIIKDAPILFQDVRVLLERPNRIYDIIKDTLESTKEQLKKIQDDFRKLENLPSLKKKDGSSIAIRRQDGRAKESLISVFVSTKELLEDIRVFVKKCKDKTKEFTDKQIKKSEQILQDIEIAAINALPIPTQAQDGQTKKEAAEEKKNQIKKYKVEIGNALKQTKAAASFGTNAATLITNVVNRDLASSKNEQILVNIAKNRFEYNVVGIDSKSPEYVREEAREKRFVDKVGLLREIETYITILISTTQDLTQNPIREQAAQFVNEGTETGKGFVEDLKAAYNQIAAAAQETTLQSQEGDARLIPPAVDSIIQTIERLTQSKSTNPADYLKAINALKKTLSGNILEQTLKSTALVYALQKVEEQYLIKTKKLLSQLLGVVREEQEVIDQNNNEDSLTTQVRERKQQIEDERRVIDEKVRSNKMYKAIKDMYEALEEGKGSIISIIFNTVVKKLDEFETFIKTEITSVVKDLKQKADNKIKKIKQEHEERLKVIIQKKVKNDLLPQSIALNIATSLFWTGAVWLNSETTTFQVIGVAPFKRLRVDGKIDGVEATVRELASNLENQLKTLQGLVIPNPATGLVPFPFVGYK